MYSFNVEQSRGETHNLIHSVMYETGCDIHQAMIWCDRKGREEARKFLDNLNRIPSWSDDSVDERVSIYVDRLGNWVRGNDSYSRCSYRYFGHAARDVETTRVVTVLPPSKSYIVAAGSDE